MDQLMKIVTNMWTRELVLVALIVLLLVRFYFRYVKAVSHQGERTRRRRTHKTLVNTRVALVVLVIALLAVVGYDRVLPHFVDSKTTQTAVSHSQSSTATSSVAAKSSSEKSSSASSGPVDAQRAVAIVKGYYEKNPTDTTNNGVDTYKYVQKGSDSSGAQVFEVGGYGNGSDTIVHLFYVHADGKFDLAY